MAFWDFKKKTHSWYIRYVHACLLICTNNLVYFHLIYQQYGFFIFRFFGKRIFLKRNNLWCKPKWMKWFALCWHWYWKNLVLLIYCVYKYILRTIFNLSGIIRIKMKTTIIALVVIVCLASCVTGKSDFVQ